MSYALGAMRRHPIVTALVAVLAAVVVGAAIWNGRLTGALIYLGAVAAGVALTELVLARWPVRTAELPVKGARFELAMIAAVFVVGTVWLVAQFVWQYHPPPGIRRLLWVGILFTCVFQAAPALVLLARRYSLAQLGLRLSGLHVAVAVLVVFASAGLILRPASSTWMEIQRETGGNLLAVVGLALTAALPEEFFRFLWQSRAGVVFGNRAVAWLSASALWSLQHAPKWWDQWHTPLPVAIAAATILPLGLLWGYVTYRTRSLLPSIVLHATNIWGLQNLS